MEGDGGQGLHRGGEVCETESDAHMRNEVEKSTDYNNLLVGVYWTGERLNICGYVAIITAVNHRAKTL